MTTNEIEEILEKKLENVEISSEEALEEKGITLNDNHNSIKYINWDIFIKYFLTIYTVVYTDVNIFYVYIGNVYKELTENTLLRIIRKLLQRLVPNSWKSNYQNEVLSTIKLEALKPSEFNQDLERLNLINGIWHLQKKRLFKHTPNLYTSNQLPINYKKNVDCPIFKKFLYDIFEGDKQRIKLIQEIMGYCLTNLVVAQKAFIFLGAGSNGKSVLIDIIIKMIGRENTSTLPLDNFSSPFRRCMLIGKKLNAVAEAEINPKTFSSGLFKAIVSGDLISAEIKGGKSFVFQPFCKIVLAMNSFPKINDQSYGLKRRMCVVVFEKIIKPKEQNKNLLSELEQELDGIFNFALEGLERLEENDFNFTVSRKCNQFMKEYFAYNNPLESFVIENIEQGTENQKILYEDLYNEYLDWCLKQGIKVEVYERKKFAMDIKNTLLLREIEFKKIKTNGDRGLKGIVWK